MNQFTTEIIQTLVKGGDISEIFRRHLESAVNTLLQTELTAFLDYEYLIVQDLILVTHEMEVIREPYTLNMAIYLWLF